MARALDTEFVTAYAKGPPPTVVQAAKELHQHVRRLLGDANFLTFLQGSYKNDTALADMNDVDLVAVLRKAPPGAHLPMWPRSSRESWEALFHEIELRLRRGGGSLGPYRREDKCIRLHSGGIDIDIVPAIAVNSPDKDPIAIYSFRAGAERKNWPRDHHEKGDGKSGETSGHFKQAVRLFKKWRDCQFSSSKVAPSYYLECLLYRMPRAVFAGDLADNFVKVGRQLVHRLYPNPDAYNVHPLQRIAGEDNLLTRQEWDAHSFEQFRSRLATSLPHAERALMETDRERARRAWRAAFNGH